MTAAIGTLGIIVINTVFPPNLPKPRGQNQVERLYSLQGGSNRARPYEPLLMVLGTHRVFPDLAAREYSEYDQNGDHILNQLFDCGIGDLTLGPMSLGTTPLNDYVTVETQSQVDRITLIKGNVDTFAGGDLGYQTGETNVVNRNTQDGVTRICFDLSVIHIRHRSSGRLEGRDTFIRLQYRPVGTANWTTHEINVRTPNGSEGKNATRRSYCYEVPDGTYETRAETFNVYPADADLNKITVNVKLDSIRGQEEIEADFTGRNPIAVRAKADGQLYGRMENLNLVVTNRLFGTPSSNPADILFWWFRGYRVNGVLRAGFGLDEEEINIPQIDAFRRHCTLHDLECNIVIEDARDENEIAMLIARCGWGRIDTSTGQYGVIFEDAGTPVTALVTPDNIIAGSLSATWENQELADEIVAEFIDRDSDYQRNQIRRYVPNTGTRGEFPVEIFFEGITDGEQAAKEVNRMAAAQFYHTKTYTWEMDESGLTSIAVGDVVGMANGLNGPGRRGGRLLEISEDRRTIKTLRKDVLTVGTIWIWALNDEILTTTYTVNEDGTLRLADPIPEPYENVPDEPLAYQYMSFDPEDAYTKVRIVAMEQGGPGQYKFIARDELQAYYDARVSDLSHELIPAADLIPRLSPLSGFFVQESTIGVRVITWREPAFPDIRGYQIRYGPGNTSFENMTNLHEGLLSGSPYESVDKPDEGTWRFGIVVVYDDGMRSRPAYVTAVLGSIIEGLSGVDGFGPEYIFCVHPNAVIPENQLPSNDWGFDDPRAANGLQYYDGKNTGLPDPDIVNQYLSRFSRYVPGRPPVGTPVEDEWSDPVTFKGYAVDGEPGEPGAPGDPASRGPSLYSYQVTSSDQAILESVGSLLPASFTNIANGLTVGGNVAGDFIRFYRGNFVQWWTWDASTDRWVRAVDLVAAARIQTIDLTAINIIGGQAWIDTLTVNNINANLRNWDPLWGGSVIVANSGSTVRQATVSWGNDIPPTTDYDLIGVAIEYTTRGATTEDVALFNPNRNTLQHFGLFGFASSPNDFIRVPVGGMEARSISFNNGNSDRAPVTVKGVFGIRNPRGGGSSTGGTTPPPPTTNLSAPNFPSSGISSRSWTEDSAISTVTVPAATGNPAPTYSASGLPSGVSFSSSTRRITGTPSNSGSGTIIVTARNSEGTDTYRVPYTIAGDSQPPTSGLPSLDVSWPIGSDNNAVSASIGINPIGRNFRVEFQISQSSSFASPSFTSSDSSASASIGNIWVYSVRFSNLAKGSGTWYVRARIIEGSSTGNWTAGGSKNFN